jgi:hypothetical protein
MSPQTRRLQGSFLLRGLLLSASLLAALIGFSQATGDSSGPIALPFDPYVHRTDGPLADPINLIFYGGDADSVAATLHKTLGWPVVEGSPMTFFDHGAVRQTRWQLGQDLGRGNRWHLRVEAVSATDGQDYVLAAVHYDKAAACGHVGGQFDPARRKVVRALADAGYHVHAISLGNTEPGPQCDGTSTAGDGTVAVIDLAPVSP